MQTFLPYPSFRRSAEVLDYRRLGKQRVEAWQILNALSGTSNGWKNHPAVKMWRGYAGALCLYGITICSEWQRRGYHDTMLSRFKHDTSIFEPTTSPAWLGNPSFHLSHRSNLLRKDPQWYTQRFAPEIVKPDMAYVWPV